MATQVIVGLKFFELIDGDGVPTAQFAPVVSDFEQYGKVHLSEVLARRLDLPRNSSPRSVAISINLITDYVRSFGLGQGAQSKACAFLMHALAFCGYEIRGRQRALPRRLADRMAEKPSTLLASRRVSLRSGGSVSLTADVDLLHLRREDREFVFRLVDLIDNYERGLQSEVKREHASLVGDEDVPF